MAQCSNGKEWDGSILKPKRQGPVTDLRPIMAFAFLRQSKERKVLYLK
jgi:hypothetical protein